LNILYLALLVLATFIWGWIFYKKEYHPQPIKVLITSFIAGLFAMIPVFGYKYIYVHFLPHLSEIRLLHDLLNSAIFDGIFFFLINMLIIVTMLTLFSGIISLLLTRFSHETLINIRNTLKDDEFEYVTMSSMIALLIFVERILEESLDVSIIHTVVGIILFLAIIEEYVKHLTVRFIDDKKIKDIDDAITLSIVVGIAFAFIETLIYAFNVGDMSIVLPRALLSMPIHVIASGIFGYYYGLSRFAEPILKAKHKEKKYTIHFKHLHTILRMKKSDIYEEEKTAQGLVLATVFHTTANMLFELDLAYITVPLIVIGLLLLSLCYKNSHFIYGLLHKKR
jgi:RsiW-degrading membrane proteinase PrsW (M82 family)